MKAQVLDKTGKQKKEIELPKAFSATIRKDILSKVFEVERCKRQHSYGAMPGAGAGYSASGILRHRRSVWKTTYGKGISRVPRKIFSRHGSSFNWQAATISSTRGGRRPHAPRSEKNLFKKINKKEFLVALSSALAGTIYETKFIVFDSSILDIKTKDFAETMKKVFSNLDKVFKRKSIRAGIGKLRGRKYRSTSGLLFVIGKTEKMKRKGISVVPVSELSVVDLAPNKNPGRLTAYTEEAIKEISEEFK